MIGLAQLELACKDASAARAAYQQAIDSGHRERAPVAMVGLADLHVRLDDPFPAQALYQQAIEAGNPDLSARASLALGRLLKKKGDLKGAKAAWQRVIDSPNAECAGPAFTDLVNLLREDDDIDGLRDAYRAGAEQQNPDVLYALDALGQHLEERGDTQAAHAASQQAIDGGYEDADDLRERISPPPELADEPEDQAELADVPIGPPARTPSCSSSASTATAASGTRPLSWQPSPANAGDGRRTVTGTAQASMIPSPIPVISGASTGRPWSSASEATATRPLPGIWPPSGTAPRLPRRGHAAWRSWQGCRVSPGAASSGTAAASSQPA
jgi:tetratricopeptide (TPR) repeat protein